MLRVHAARRAGVVFPLLVVLIFAATSCGGGGSPGPGDKTEDQVDLICVGFSHSGRTDVYRNQPLTFTFNTTVKKSTVSDRTVQVRTGPSLQTEAKGRYHVDGNVIVFDPRESEEQLRKRTIINQNPFGFDPLATYQVLVVGPPTVKRLQNNSGKGVIAEFFSTFRTIDEYVPEMTQPQFIGDVDNQLPDKLAFLPEQDPTGEILQDSLIVLIFDEAIDPATVDPEETVRFYKRQLVAPYFQDYVSGTFSHDASARRWVFESSFGFGGGPYEVSVTLTPGIKDLAGNPLGNPTVLTFNTKYEATVPNNGSLREPFDNTRMREFSETTASWDGNVPGSLVGGDIITTLHEVSLNISGGTRTQLGSPLTDNSEGSHTQMLYLQSEIGGDGTIAEVLWGPEFNTQVNGYGLFAAYHDKMVLKMGHCSTENLSIKFPENWNVGTPVRVYDGDYTIPAAADIGSYSASIQQGYFAWPSFTSYFDYDGVNNLVFDVDTKAGTNFQSMRVFYGYSVANPMNAVIGNRRLYGPYMADSGTPTTWWGPPYNPECTVYDMLFVKRRRVTYAQSKFFDSLVPNADYATPIISPPVQSGGATFILQFEGAQGMEHPTYPSWSVPDPSTYTGWVENLDALDGYRYIRWKFTLIANLISDTVPRINSLVIPYIF